MEGDLVLPPGHKQRELISIHSLRMEGDLYPYGYSDASDISIHSLRMEGDDDKQLRVPSMTLFQSTPSAWRETQQNQKQSPPGTISIHSLRMEGDWQLQP